MIGVSGGPDSLALSALTNTIAEEKKYKFFYAMVDHGIRKNSGSEATKVKKLLNKHGISLEILKNKKKITNNIQRKARDVRYQLLESFCIKKKDKNP